MEPKETASDLWRRSLSSLKTVHWDQSKTGGHPAHKHQGQNLIKNVSLSRHPPNPTTNVLIKPSTSLPSLWSHTHCRLFPAERGHVSDCSLNVLLRIIGALTNRAQLSRSCYSRGQAQTFKHELKRKSYWNSSQPAAAAVSKIKRFSQKGLSSAQPSVLKNSKMCMLKCPYHLTSKWSFQ